MERLRHRIWAVAAATALVAALGLASALPGTAQPAESISLNPTSGPTGSTTAVSGTNFKGVGDVTITEGGRFAAIVTPTPSGRFDRVITITGFGPVLVRACQSDGSNSCGYDATATFTTPTTTTTTTTVPTTTTTSTTTTTTVPTTTTTTAPSTTTTTDPSTTTTTVGSTTSTTAAGSTTTVTVATTTTVGPPGLGAPEGSQSVVPDRGDAGAEPAEVGEVGEVGSADDNAGIAAARIARNTEEVAIWPFMLGGGAVWLLAIGIWLLARRRASLRP